MKFTFTDQGHLRFELETAEDKQWVRDTLETRGGNDILFLSDLLEYTGWQGNGQFMQLAPEDIGVLTQAPLVTDHIERDDAGKVTTIGTLYWFPYYESTHFGEHLRDVGYVIFGRTATPEPVAAQAERSPMRQAIKNVVAASEEIATSLAGYATQAAIRELSANWNDALRDANPEFFVSSMRSDIDKVIENLQALKLGLANSPDESNRLMREQLGI